VFVNLRKTIARSILSPTTGFIAEAGFTHSLTPARNCTFGCAYCYVPTMRIYAGLRPEDWQRWGQFTTFKSNAPELLARELKSGQRIYCSPLVDPYQPAEAEERLMPRILEAVIESPPRVFCLQTRGTLILRDLHLLRGIENLRVSFSITTDRDDVRRLYEPHCATFQERLETVRELRAAGIETYATLAPLLPCDPENLARAAIQATGRNLIGDPLHVRSVKPRGATTRDAAFRIAETQGQEEWLDAEFQASIVERIDREARQAGFRFETGPRGFARLAQ
jgi:DNA repair photolyase